MPRHTAENARHLDVRIHLNGVEIEGALEVDDDLGFVVRRTKVPPLYRELLVGEVTVDIKRRDG